MARIKNRWCRKHRIFTLDDMKGTFHMEVPYKAWLAVYRAAPEDCPDAASLRKAAEAEGMSIEDLLFNFSAEGCGGSMAAAIQREHEENMVRNWRPRPSSHKIDCPTCRLEQAITVNVRHNDSSIAPALVMTPQNVCLKCGHEEPVEIVPVKAENFVDPADLPFNVDIETLEREGSMSLTFDA